MAKKLKTSTRHTNITPKQRIRPVTGYTKMARAVKRKLDASSKLGKTPTQKEMMNEIVKFKKDYINRGTPYTTKAVKKIIATFSKNKKGKK